MGETVVSGCCLVVCGRGTFGTFGTFGVEFDLKQAHGFLPVLGLFESDFYVFFGLQRLNAADF